MLFLQFQLDQDRYLLNCADVIEVLPLLQLKQIPQAPVGVCGMLNYHGQPVPVIDLSELSLGRSARHVMSTRIVIVHYVDARGLAHRLGLIAENATRQLRRDAADFTDGGVRNDGAPYLGPMTTDADGLLQSVEVGRLLPDSVRDVLFQEAQV